MKLHTLGSAMFLKRFVRVIKSFFIGNFLNDLLRNGFSFFVISSYVYIVAFPEFQSEDYTSWKRFWTLVVSSTGRTLLF